MAYVYFIINVVYITIQLWIGEDTQTISMFMIPMVGMQIVTEIRRIYKELEKKC